MTRLRCLSMLLLAAFAGVAVAGPVPAPARPTADEAIAVARGWLTAAAKGDATALVGLSAPRLSFDDRFSGFVDHCGRRTAKTHAELRRVGRCLSDDLGHGATGPLAKLLPTLDLSAHDNRGGARLEVRAMLGREMIVLVIERAPTGLRVVSVVDSLLAHTS